MTKEQNTDAPEIQHDELAESELRNIVEAAIFASSEPIGIKKLMALFPSEAQPDTADLKKAIEELEEIYQLRGVELKKIGKGWRFRSRERYATWLRRLNANKPPRYSKALLETLSIIAYRQPVTRGDIEEIRGVGVSSETIRTLEDRGWITEIGHRDVPGRPALFGTTQDFLEYFSLESLRDLPELVDKRDIEQIAKDLNLVLPPANTASELPDNQGATKFEQPADVIPLHATEPEH